MTEAEELRRICSQVRRDIIRMTHSAKSGHPGGSLGCTEWMAALYWKLMKHDPGNFTMTGKNEDVFILSNGHICPVWYSVLARQGYFDVTELSTFRKINSRLQGHPATAEGLPGVRVATGSLGQGLSVAIGIALSKKHNGDGRLVYSLHGDGEIQEGQVWEAAMFAAKYKVNNLIATIDCNGRQIDGDVKNIMPLGDLRAKWCSFGWYVMEMEGNDIEDVLRVMRLAAHRRGNGLPTVVLMKTEMGYGVDFMTGTHKWHGVAPNDEEAVRALSQLEESMGDY